MIIISNQIPINLADFNRNSPQVGYDNAVAVGNVASDTADASYPISNVANPSTASEWRASSTALQYITVTLSAADRLIDYVGIARHNLGTGGGLISIEGNTGSGWVELVQGVYLGDDAPKIFRFTPDYYTGIRLKIGATTTAARLAVLYCGKMLELQRRIAVGHTPLPLGRQRKTVTGRSESGNFLGRILSGGQATSAIGLRNIEPGWYRTKLDPFILAAETDPFFFAWKPGDYPREIGYAWLTADPVPKISRANGMMEVDLQMTGIIK